MAGRGKDVTDARLLLEFVLTPDPVLEAIEITDSVELTRQGVGKRLNELVEDGYLDSKKPGRDKIYWLTDEGKQFLMRNVDPSQLERSIE